MRRACGVLLALVLTGCGLGGSGDAPERTTGPATGSGSVAAGREAPAEPTWGPSNRDLRQARRLVADWGADRLAGQLIVAGYAGTDPELPGRMVRDLHLAGISVGGFNVASAGQVRATTRAVAAAARADGRRYPPVLAVDQEGGIVEHLRGVASPYPPFAAAGTTIQRDPKQGRRVVRQAMAAQAVELRSFGFSWVLGPVADVTIGAADVTIGSRSASADPAIAAGATVAAMRGYQDAVTVPVLKHYPGHGAVTTDSHVARPQLDVGRRLLERRELVPFRAGVDAGAPVVMTSHVEVRALAPGQAASLAPAVYQHLRRVLGFDGVVVTDALEMGAVTDRPSAAVQALRAGADLVLMPDDPPTAHAQIAAAIRSGDLPHQRVLRSVVRVVALQLWQQRQAAAVPVPPDATARAQAAASRLSDAGG